MNVHEDDTREPIDIDQFLRAPEWSSICLLEHEDVPAVTELMTLALYDDLSSTFVYPRQATRDVWLRRSMRQSAEFAAAWGFTTAIYGDAEGRDIVSVAKWIASPFLGQNSNLLGTLFGFTLPHVFLHPRCYSRLCQFAQLSVALRPNTPNYLQLNGLGTHAGHRGRGYASKLVECGLAYAQETDWPAFLFCWEELTPFYQRFGFERCSEAQLPGSDVRCHGMLWTP